MIWCNAFVIRQNDAKNGIIAIAGVNCRACLRLSALLAISVL
jgi:hypothetical protein